MAEGEVEGLKATLARLDEVSWEIVNRVADAVETSAIRVANHAKAGHQPGQGHANGRYENQSSILTNAIIPQQIKKTKEQVVVLVHTGAVDYAPRVEFGGTDRDGTERRPYPFMLPAADSQREQFPKTLRAAIRGNA